jgi:hypothetical protein
MPLSPIAITARDRALDRRNCEQPAPQTRRVQPSRCYQRFGGRLLEVVVYDKCCRIGGTLSLDHLAATSEVGDWKMPDFRIART